MVKSRPYYQRYLTQWGKHLRQQKERGLAHSSEVVAFDFAGTFEAWLERLGGNPRMEDFQIRQAADSVLIAHGDVLGEEWAAAGHWAQWVESVIFARESELDREIDGPQHVGSLIETAQAKGMGEGRAAVIGKLVTRMRERHYAYRTEQTYREWAERFLLWNGAGQLGKRVEVTIGVGAPSV